MENNIVIVIQARMGSSRLPGKVMLPLEGKSLLARMAERLKMVRYPATLVIATTEDKADDVIVQEARKLNIPYYRGDANNLLDRHYQAAMAHQAQYVLKIPSDCPLIDPQVVDNALEYFFKGKYDYVSNLHPATWPDGNDVEIMTIDCLKRTWQNASKPLELEHTTPYIWENPDQFTIGNINWETGLDLSMSHRFTIDYIEDYRFIERVFEELYPVNPNFSCEDIIDLLAQKPEIYALNAHYAGVNWYRNHLNELKTISQAHTRNPTNNQMTIKNTEYTDDDLRSIALKVREHIIQMSTNGGCFTGASLSAADLIVYLYTRFLNISPANLHDAGRDYLLLSKGHDVPALYGTLAELGFIEKERLKNHLSADDHIYWHPNTRIPGIEFHSGSLGHLPSVAIGIAMDIKISGAKNKVVCILGDGELNEGTCWEALLVANAHKLDNLIFVVDRNHFQANMRTEELIPLEPLAQKFEAFGAAVKRINGHDFTALHDAFTAYPFKPGKVNVVIADTVRGKGLPSIQERADRWFCNFTSQEIEQLLQELHGNQLTELTSETLVVR